MQILNLALLLVLVTTATACGNPVALRKELDTEQERRKVAAQDLEATDRQAERLKRALSTVTIRGNNRWVVSGIEEFDTAVKVCESFGYKMPSRALLAEFPINDVLPPLSDDAGPSKRVHDTDESEAEKDSAQRWVVCYQPIDA